MFLNGVLALLSAVLVQTQSFVKCSDSDCNDVVYLVDMSQSIGNTAWTTQVVPAVQASVTELLAAPNTTVSVIVFSSCCASGLNNCVDSPSLYLKSTDFSASNPNRCQSSRVLKHFNQTWNPNSLGTKTYGGTFTGYGLALAKWELDTYGRPGCKKSLVVLTDGSPARPAGATDPSYVTDACNIAASLKATQDVENLLFLESPTGTIPNNLFTDAKCIASNISQIKNISFDNSELIVQCKRPTLSPTRKPSSGAPTRPTTKFPSFAPTKFPTIAPTLTPSIAPTFAPTIAPTQTPTITPTQAPTQVPTAAPTRSPTQSPTLPHCERMLIQSCPVLPDSPTNYTAVSGHGQFVGLKPNPPIVQRRFVVRAFRFELPGDCVQMRPSSWENTYFGEYLPSVDSSAPLSDSSFWKYDRYFRIAQSDSWVMEFEGWQEEPLRLEFNERQNVSLCVRAPIASGPNRLEVQIGGVIGGIFDLPAVPYFMDMAIFDPSDDYRFPFDNMTFSEVELNLPILVDNPTQASTCAAGVTDIGVLRNTADCVHIDTKTTGAFAVGEWAGPTPANGAPEFAFEDCARYVDSKAIIYSNGRVVICPGFGAPPSGTVTEALCSYSYLPATKTASINVKSLDRLSICKTACGIQLTLEGSCPKFVIPLPTKGDFVLKGVDTNMCPNYAPNKPAVFTESCAFAITEAPTTAVPSTARPTQRPNTRAPGTSRPTLAPTSRPTLTPTLAPSKKPTISPTLKPTKQPTNAPNPPKTTDKPTKVPTKQPTMRPSKVPTSRPSKKPTRSPTIKPTKTPTRVPTFKPTKVPTLKPTKKPTKSPTLKPTKKPTKSPTLKPTKQPTLAPTNRPSRA